MTTAFFFFYKLMFNLTRAQHIQIAKDNTLLIVSVGDNNLLFASKIIFIRQLFIYFFKIKYLHKQKS